MPRIKHYGDVFYAIRKLTEHKNSEKRSKSLFCNKLSE